MAVKKKVCNIVQEKLIISSQSPAYSSERDSRPSLEINIRPNSVPCLKSENPVSSEVLIVTKIRNQLFIQTRLKRL